MVVDAMKKRFSVRKFSEREVEEVKLLEILEAARIAPSAKNLQSWKFVVIRDPEKRKALTDVCKGQTFVSEAPLTIAVCCGNLEYRMTCGQYPHSIDGAIAGEHIALQAAELGLGSCWIGAFHQDKAKELISLPDDWQIIALFPIGYPDEEHKIRPRKSLEEIVSYDTF